LRRRPDRTQPAATPHARRWLRLQGAVTHSEAQCQGAAWTCC